ncbi:helix-turn-helix domain-containing protein [Rhodospirillum centenum]|uniref:DNA-binding protein, putative n=1 Tax=Rhodospirillum centenum (strain ATCC 51521 / SW) TaxID=414684 RepID=B6IXD2_RHOCS|nr:helix-turn-helix transcriptional regulator [Rhodospirillum centenum]ACJ00956.1 DNA-binding protein, putative [Rhodospirillum centenum SW]
MPAEPERAAAIRDDLRRQAGRWLKAQREAAGLTQADVAERLGLRYYTFVSQVEGGHGRIPPEHYEGWARAVGIDARIFAKMILRYYDPEMHRLLFPEEAQVAVPTRTAAGGGSAA